MELFFRSIYTVGLTNIFFSSCTIFILQCPDHFKTSVLLLQSIAQAPVYHLHIAMWNERRAYHSSVFELLIIEFTLQAGILHYNAKTVMNTSIIFFSYVLRVSKNIANVTHAPTPWGPHRSVELFLFIVILKTHKKLLKKLFYFIIFNKK